MSYPNPYDKIQFFDDSGNPLSGGKVYSYTSGTLTPKSTYTDASEGTPNANPVILDSAGRANIWLGSGGYKIILKTSADVTIWTVDNIPGNGFFSGDLAVSGNATIAGTLGVTGNVAVNTNKFNVAAVSGNTTMAGTLAATGAITGSSTISGAALIPTGSMPPVNGLYLPAANTSAITANSLDVVRYKATALSVNYFSFQGGAAGSAPTFSTEGADTNIGMVFSAKGSGQFDFRGNGGTDPVLSLIPNAGAVNYPTIFNGTAGNSVTYGALGADANITVTIAPKGTGVVQVVGNAGSAPVTSFNTPKAQGFVQWSGGVPALVGSSTLNIASVTDNGVGDVTLNLGVTFANIADMLAQAIVYDTSGTKYLCMVRALTTTSVRVQTFTTAGVLTDVIGIMVVVFGKI